MTRFVPFFASLLLLVACRPEAIEKMAHATKQMDATYSAAYAEAADDCLEASSGWAEYDACMEPWETGAEALGVVHDAALALDTADARLNYKAAGCAWFRAVAVLDAVSPVEIPAAATALTSRWNRRC